MDLTSVSSLDDLWPVQINEQSDEPQMKQDSFEEYSTALTCGEIQAEWEGGSRNVIQCRTNEITLPPLKLNMYHEMQDENT